MWITALTFAVFGGFVFALTKSSAYAFGMWLGPYAGGYAREWQSCCAENSYGLAPYGIGGVLAGVAAQFVLGRSMRRSRLLLFGGGCVAWFGTALLSYAHALE